jgi:chorismate mutase-like protein
MSELNPLRERIDQIDTELLSLLNERARVVKKIGVIKEKEGRPIYAPEREEALLRRLDERNPGPLTARSLRAIYREIMSASLSLEKHLVVACAGPRGGLCHQAALGKFGSSIEYSFGAEVADVFSMVEKHQGDCGVIPVENSEIGAVGPTFDALARTELSVCAEIRLQNDNSAQPPDRFYVLGNTANPPSGRDRTLFLLRLSDKPSSLFDALQPFVERQINLHHFANRPAAGGSEDLMFFLEADGHLKELQETGLLRDLAKRSRAVKTLGSFPALGN